MSLAEERAAKKEIRDVKETKWQQTTSLKWFSLYIATHHPYLQNIVIHYTVYKYT